MNAPEPSEREFIERGAQNVSEHELDEVLLSPDRIMEKMRGPLYRFVDDVKLLISMVRDYRGGQYRKIPYRTVAGIVFALLYVLNPLDVVPDFIPGIGLIDDAAVVAAVLKLFEKDLLAYGEWKAGRIIGH
ncbi:DUF1232 domain-containing protein [bacterium]|nr:DUF1232 domain-containing protein [bacterium]